MGMASVALAGGGMTAAQLAGRPMPLSGLRQLALGPACGQGARRRIVTR
jgi:hypothetical protein